MPALFLTNCAESGIMPDSPDNGGQDEEVSIFMSIEVRDIDASRQYSRASENEADKWPVNDKEKMNTLRVIVANSEGKVEGNQFFSFGEGRTKYGQMEFKVKPRDTKTIYVLSNCEGYTFRGSDNQELSDNYFATLRKGSSLNVESAKSLTLGLEENETPLAVALPITTIDVVRVESSDIEHDILVHRAATKYTYRIQNLTPQSILLGGIHISSHTDKEFLFPNATYTTNSRGETILESYTTPPDAVGSNLDVNYDSAIELPANMEQPKEIGPIYQLEGLKLTPSSYKTTLTLNGIKQEWKDLNWHIPEETTPKKLMTDLPRNTHVVVNVKISHDYSLIVTVNEQPYSYVELDPEFGLDRDENGNIIIKKN